MLTLPLTPGTRLHKNHETSHRAMTWWLWCLRWKITSERGLSAALEVTPNNSCYYPRNPEGPSSISQEQPTYWGRHIIFIIPSLQLHPGRCSPSAQPLSCSQAAPEAPAQLLPLPWCILAAADPVSGMSVALCSKQGYCFRRKGYCFRREDH